MNRFKVVLAEAWRSITASISTTIAATMTVLIGMFLVGLLIASAPGRSRGATTRRRSSSSRSTSATPLRLSR